MMFTHQITFCQEYNAMFKQKYQLEEFEIFSVKRGVSSEKTQQKIAPGVLYLYPTKDGSHQHLGPHLHLCLSRCAQLLSLLFNEMEFRHEIISLYALKKSFQNMVNVFTKRKIVTYLTAL